MLFPALISQRQNAVPLKLVLICLNRLERRYHARFTWMEWTIISVVDEDGVLVYSMEKELFSDRPHHKRYIINRADLNLYESYEINIDERMILLNDSIRKAC